MDEKAIIEKALFLKLITKNQLHQCMQRQKKENISILSILTQQNLLGTTQLANLTREIQQVKPTSKNFFGKYEILEELGRGGIAVVYKVLDSNLKRIVALKLISSFEITKKQKKSFLREASACAQLNHPNIIKVFEVGHTPQIYFTMEYVKGGDLTKSIPKLNSLEVANIIKKCAIALNVIHQKNIIHRDIKPCNIMITENGEPKLVDFGLAKSLSQNNLSQTGTVSGTPFYMSPEQANGEKLSKSTDIYSLGATLYECLTNRKVFEEKNHIQLIKRICSENPIPLQKLNSEIPIDLEIICLKCLEKNPKNRYKNAKLLAKDLENFIKNRPIVASPPNVFNNLNKFIKRNKVLCLSICAITIFFITIISSYIIILKNHNKQIKQEKIKAETEKTKSVDILKSILISLRKFYKNQKPLQENNHLVFAIATGLKELNRLDIIDEKNEELLVLYAYILGRKKLTQKRAIKMYNKIIKKNPENAKMYVTRGELYYSQKEYQLSLKDYNTAIKLKKETIFYIFRANLYIRLKQYNAAIKDYLIALSVTPNNIQLHYKIAQLYYELKLYAKAIESYTKVVKLKPNLEHSYVNIGIIYCAQKKYKVALSYFNQTLKLNPKNQIALLNRGNTYSKLNKEAKAEKDFIMGLKLNLKSKDFITSLAILYERLKKYNTAIKYWKKMLILVSESQKKEILVIIKKIKEKQNN